MGGPQLGSQPGGGPLGPKPRPLGNGGKGPAQINQNFLLIFMFITWWTETSAWRPEASSESKAWPPHSPAPRSPPASATSEAPASSSLSVTILAPAPILSPLFLVCKTKFVHYMKADKSMLTSASLHLFRLVARVWTPAILAVCHDPGVSGTVVTTRDLQ